MIVSEVSYGSPESRTGGGTSGLLPVAITIRSAVRVVVSAPSTRRARGPVRRACPVWTVIHGVSVRPSRPSRAIGSSLPKTRSRTASQRTPSRWAATSKRCASVTASTTSAV